MSSNTIQQDPGTTLPGVIIIPEEEPSSTNWFKENPVVVAAIAVGIVLLLIVLLFCYIRKKRKASASKGEVNISQTESQADAPAEGSIAPDDVFTESFVIIRSPNFYRQKRKSTLAVPPAFSVSHNQRKSAPSAPHELIAPVVGWTRWSSAGLEVHPSPQPEAKEMPISKEHLRRKRKSTPGIVMAVPVVYRHRRVSHGHTHHAVYGPERHAAQSRRSTPS